VLTVKEDEQTLVKELLEISVPAEKYF